MIRIAGLVLLSFLCLPVLGQSQAETRRLADILDKQEEIVLTAQRNLLDMGMRLSEPESGRVRDIVADTAAVQMAIATLSTLSSLHSMMIDDRDRAVLRKYVVLQATAVLTYSEVSLHGVNATLAQLRSPAAIAETQKLRDALQATEARILQTIPKVDKR